MRIAVEGRKGRGGFTLAELAVVIMLFGVLASFGVPRFITSAERTKAAEAFTYLAAVRAAQERHHERTGVYAPTVAALELAYPPPRHFSIREPMTGPDAPPREAWSLTLTRAGAAAGYGPYTVVFNQDGYDPSSGISAFPGINPMGDDAARPRSRP